MRFHFVSVCKARSHIACVELLGFGNGVWYRSVSPWLILSFLTGPTESSRVRAQATRLRFSASPLWFHSLQYPPPPNNSFKPTPHRGINSVLCATLHAVATPLRGGLTQALGAMRRILALILALLIANASYASELTISVGDLVEASSKNGVHAVEFCPDNTCDRFTLRGRKSRPLHDFVFAYLFAIDTDPALKQFQYSRDTPQLQAVLMRYSTVCRETEPKLAARCVAVYLARRYPIRAAFVRYDEGRHESPRPIGDFIGGT